MAKAVAVEVDANAGYLHLPLQLVIGASENPDRLHFLVSVLCVRTSQGWRIAALFTAPEETRPSGSSWHRPAELIEPEVPEWMAGTMSGMALSSEFQLQSRHSAYGQLRSLRLRDESGAALSTARGTITAAAVS